MKDVLLIACYPSSYSGSLCFFTNLHILSPCPDFLCVLYDLYLRILSCVGFPFFPFITVSYREFVLDFAIFCF